MSTLNLNEDLMHVLLYSSDPYTYFMRKVLKNVIQELSQGVREEHPKKTLKNAGKLTLI
jgi:hypothetical protein